MSEIVLPDLSLVVLIGVSGSGKSTFARTHFRPTQVLSSDACRGLVADDENDQSATPAAFDVLHHIAAVRLRGGRLTVVDATNLKREDRAGLVRLAREADVLPVAVVLDVPEQVCLERNAARSDRDLHAGVVRRHRADLRRGLRGLAREGFRKVHVLSGVDEVAAATVRYEKQYNDRRDETGPFDVIGDVHGCRAELERLLDRLGYALRRDSDGRPVDAEPLAGRTAVFLGDLVDRGPDTPGVLRLVMGMVAAGHALCVPGNHENKLVRALRGRDVQVTHGLERSLEQLSAEPEEFRRQVEEFCHGLVSHYVLDGGRLVVAHAGLKESLQGRSSSRVRACALYGETTGETDEFGLPVRHPWAAEYRGRAMVLYGHTPTPAPEWVNGTLCLDTGCVFGGRLTALRYPERELVAVDAARTYYEPARPFLPAGETAPPVEQPPQRDGDVLDVDDVLGKRVVETRFSGRVTVREENAAAAIEVMSRFAVAPQQLLYLPPTMSPSATTALPGCWSTRRRRSPTTAARVCRRWCARPSTWAPVPWPSCAAVTYGGTRPGARRSGGRSTPGQGGRSSPARSPRSSSRGSPARRRRPGCSTSSAATGCCWTPSCCPGRPRPRTSSAGSTPPSVRPPGPPCPRA